MSEDEVIEWTGVIVRCEVCDDEIELTTDDKEDDTQLCAECDDLSGWREGQPEFNGAFGG